MSKPKAKRKVWPRVWPGFFPIGIRTGGHVLATVDIRNYPPLAFLLLRFDDLDPG